MSAGRELAPFYRHMGFKVESRAGGEAEIALDLREEVANRRGQLHGGALAALVDAAMTQALLSTLPLTAALATISLTTSYLRPGSGAVVARARALHAGRSIATAEVTIQDAAGAIIVRGLGTYRVFSSESG